MNIEQMFLNPERLWWLLLIPLLVAAYVYLTRRKNRSGMRFTNTGVLGAVVPVQSQWRRHLAVALTLLSLAALTIAWSRPMPTASVTSVNVPPSLRMSRSGWPP